MSTLYNKIKWPLLDFMYNSLQCNSVKLTTWLKQTLDNYLQSNRNYCLEIIFTTFPINITGIFKLPSLLSLLTQTHSAHFSFGFICIITPDLSPFRLSSINQQCLLFFSLSNIKLQDLSSNLLFCFPLLIHTVHSSSSYLFHHTLSHQWIIWPYNFILPCRNSGTLELSLTKAFYFASLFHPHRRYLSSASPFFFGFSRFCSLVFVFLQLLWIQRIALMLSLLSITDSF